MGMHIRFMNRCGGWCESTVGEVNAPAPFHLCALTAASDPAGSPEPPSMFFCSHRLTAVTISARWKGKLAGPRFMGVKRRDGDAGTEGKKGEHYAFRICPVGSVDTGR